MTARGRLMLQDLSHAEVGALLVAFHAGTLHRLRRGWFDEDLSICIAPATFLACEKKALFRRGRDDRTACLTPAGLALADLAVTLSREIAAGVRARDGRPPLTFLPDPVQMESAPAPSTAATRLRSRHTPRDILLAQIERARARMEKETAGD